MFGNEKAADLLLSFAIFNGLYEKTFLKITLHEAIIGMMKLGGHKKFSKV